MILQSTGTELLNPALIWNWLQTNGLDFFWSILAAIIVYVVGKILKRYLGKAAEKLMQRSSFDETVRNFLGNVIRISLTAVLWIIVLSTLGFNPQSLLVILGGASLAVGLALKDNLSNLAGGVMMLMLKPFKKGDYIDGAGESGTVEEIQIYYTVLKTPTNELIVVPNGSMASSVIKNYSAFETRRLDLTFGIGYNDDIDKAKSLLNRLIKNESRIFADPAPAVLVSELADSSVNFTLRLWVKGADFWPTRFDMIERVKKSFDENGVSIPFPQRDVHMYQVNK
jgi:small conductance mechanosensitive channel